MSENLGIYIHIPYCRSKCAYCSFVSDTCFDDCENYIDALIREIRGGVSRPADTVYIGGGTPSVLPRGELKRVLNAVRESYDLATDAEISAECNPDSATGEFFDECAQAGVNRISIGVQSANDALLKKIGRIHTFSQARAAFFAARAAGIDNISADVMLGLPSQTLFDVKETLSEILSLEPEHLSVYGLSVEEGTPLFRSGYTVDEDMCADFYEYCADRLMSEGFFRYEVSNFAKAGRICRHNAKYWSGAPYYGFGAAAHSYTGNRRYSNTEDRGEYIKGVRAQRVVCLGDIDKIEERIMLSLRTAVGLDLNDLKASFGYDLLERKEKEIKRLIELDMLSLSDGRLCLTDKAYYKMNAVIVSLL